MPLIDDKHRLNGVLSELGRMSFSENTERRHLNCKTGLSSADAIFAEVSETILRRRIEFRVDGGKLELDVSERRVFCVPGVSGAWMKDFPDLAGQPLSRADAGDLKKLIHAFAAAEAKIEVSVRLPAEPPDFSSEGIPVNDLILTGEEWATTGFRACETLAIASVLVVPKKEAEHKGEPGYCERLDAVRRSYSGPEPVMIWMGGLTDNIGVAVFRTQDFDAAMAFSGESLPDLLKAIADPS